MKKIIFKYVKQLQKSTLIYPSEVNFLNEPEFKIDDDLLVDLNSKIDTLSKGQYPKLQITQKNGYWFCLNNTMLVLFQNLQQKKKVDKIACEVISLDKVPEYLQKEMVLNYDCETSESSDSCCSSCANYNDTITTIISLNRNKHVTSFSDSDNQTNDQNFKTSLINNENQSERSSLSSSDLSIDDNQKALDYSLNCAFCNQTFSTSKNLSRHKLKKKHFVCICGERFKSLTKLESHRHTQEHWSDEID